MSKLKTVLLAAAAAGGLAATASAMPMNDIATQGPVLVQKTAMICDDRGRCVETRRHVQRFYRDYDSDYGPPAYGYYDPGPGVDFRFGFGPHRHWR
jgi:hypothetical protein